MLEEIQDEEKDVKKTEYKEYIKNLKKLMIKDKADKLDKLKDIGKKIIELDNAKQTLKKLEVMLNESEVVEEVQKGKDKTKKATIEGEENADGKQKVQGAKEGDDERLKKKDKIKEGVEKAMNVENKDKKKVGKIDLASVQKFLEEDQEIEVNAIKNAFEKTKQETEKDYYDLFAKITKTDFIDDNTKYKKGLLTDIAFGKNVIILESEKSDGVGLYNDVFAIRTDDDQPKIVSVMIKENDTLKFETLSNKLPIGEGGKIPKDAEDELNKNNKDEVLINLDKFKDLFPKYIGDAATVVGGGGKRKSKSRKSRKGRKGRKGRKNKTKKRSKSKK